MLKHSTEPRSGTKMCYSRFAFEFKVAVHPNTSACNARTWHIKVNESEWYLFRFDMTTAHVGTVSTTADHPFSNFQLLRYLDFSVTCPLEKHDSAVVTKQPNNTVPTPMNNENERQKKFFKPGADSGGIRGIPCYYK